MCSEKAGGAEIRATAQIGSWQVTDTFLLVFYAIHVSRISSVDHSNWQKLSALLSYVI